MGITVKGVDASLLWVYHQAAVLRDWTISTEDGSRVLRATLLNADTYRLSQRPIVFVAKHAKGVWRFPVLELQISGVSLSARLGPQEKPDAVPLCSS